MFETRKNLDLRKILVTPKIFLKSRFHCTSRAEILQIFGWHVGRNDDLIIQSEFNWPLSKTVAKHEVLTFIQPKQEMLGKQFLNTYLQRFYLSALIIVLLSIFACFWY